MKRLFFFIFLSAVFFTSSSQASSISGEDSLVDVVLLIRHMDAVRVDMERFILYRRGSPGYQEDETAKALLKLKKLERKARSVHLHEDLETVRQPLMSSLRGLELYITGYSSKTEEGLERAEELYTRRRERLWDRIREVTSSLRQPQLSDDHDPLVEESEAFAGEDRVSFEQACAWIQEKKFEQARAELEKLLLKYKQTRAEGSLVLRLARCRAADAQVPEPEIQRLEKSITSGVYFVNLYDVYVEWRGLYQGFYYGYNDDALIANELFVDKLERSLRAILAHLQKNPQDQWARQQLFMLISLRVIERDGDLLSEE